MKRGHFSPLCVALCALICVLGLTFPTTARASAPPDGQIGGQAGEFRVLASTFPVWLFTRNVCQDVPSVQVELFVPAKTGCPHEFTPSPAELRRLAQADAIVINGLGLEAFLAQPLRTLDKEHAIIDASRGTDPLPAPAGDGGHVHASGDGHGHGHVHNHAHEGGAPGVNPHIFAGPAQAALMARAIADGLARRDPAHAEAYRANAAAFAGRLEALAKELAAIGSAAPRKGIVLQHDDLAYLAHEAGLETLDVLRPGDENSALSAAQLHALTRRLKAEAPVLIAGEPPAPDRAVELLSAESGVPYALLDPVAAGPADAAPDYYERAMVANAETLRRYFDAP